MNKKLLLATTCLTAVSLVGHTNAEVVTSFDFSGGTPLTNTGGSFSSTIGFEAGITGSSTASGDLRIQGVQTVGGGVVGDEYTDSDQVRITSNNWITFSITVPDTQEIDLTSLDFDYTQIDPASFLLGVYTSKTGFTEGDHLLGIFDDGISSGTITTYNNSSVNLSGIAALQNLTDETVEIRFLLGDNSGATSRIHVLDNIVLNGTVIPEPGSLALLGLGGLCVLKRRRRDV